MAIPLLAMTLAACGGGNPEAGDRDADGVTQAPVSGPRMVAVGDVACPAREAPTSETCRQRDTAALVRRLDPDAVALLGDMQYPDGSLRDFRTSFGPLFRPLANRLHPTPGNHEHATPGAAGYFAFFGRRAGPAGRGWYSYELGDWHVLSLDGNCEIVDCDDESPQQRWLAADLAAHPARCTLAYWHQPRFSSGPHGSDEAVAPLWRTLQDAGADVVLSGHDHAYERFEPQDADGTEDERRGIVQFVVGSGGASRYPAAAIQPNSAARDRRFGVLVLTLGSGAVRWRFAPVAVPGSSRGADHGTFRCR